MYYIICGRGQASVALPLVFLLLGVVREGVRVAALTLGPAPSNIVGMAATPDGMLYVIDIGIARGKGGAGVM